MPYLLKIDFFLLKIKKKIIQPKTMSSFIIPSLLNIPKRFGSKLEFIGAVMTYTALTILCAVQSLYIIPLCSRVMSAAAEWIFPGYGPYVMLALVVFGLIVTIKIN
jgi:hypothetical protein